MMKPQKWDDPSLGRRKQHGGNPPLGTKNLAFSASKNWPWRPWFHLWCHAWRIMQRGMQLLCLVITPSLFLGSHEKRWYPSRAKEWGNQGDSPFEFRFITIQKTKQTNKIQRCWVNTWAYSHWKMDEHGHWANVSMVIKKVFFSISRWDPWDCYDMTRTVTHEIQLVDITSITSLSYPRKYPAIGYQ